MMVIFLEYIVYGGFDLVLGFWGNMIDELVLSFDYIGNIFKVYDLIIVYWR